jgi:Zn-dependent protease
VQLLPTSTSTTPHFHVLGVPVRVETSFFVVTVMLSLNAREPWRLFAWLAVCFVCILVHELGHALTARAFGQRVRIALHGMGGSAWHEGPPPLTTTKRVLVCLAGPFAGFALGAVAWVLPPIGGPVGDIVIANILWSCWGYGALNLLPIVPLDGGHVVLALLRGRLGEDRGAVWADVVSVVAAAVVVVVAISTRSFSLGFIVVWLLIARAGQLIELVRAWRDRRFDDDVAAFNAAQKAGQHEEVARRGAALLSVVASARVRAEVAHGTAWAHVSLGRFADADSALVQLPAGWTVAPLLRARVSLGLERYDDAVAVLRPVVSDQPAARPLLVKALAGAGHHDDAVDVARAGGEAHEARHVLEEALYFAGRLEESLAESRQLFALHTCPRAAYNATCACCLLSRVDDALWWWERAVQAGWQNAAAAVDDDDLALIRSHPRFVELLAQVLPRET